MASTRGSSIFATIRCRSLISPWPPATPGRPPYEHEVVKKWTAAIAQSDGFVFVTPEYNYGPAAVLKNAIDWVYPEWNRKAVGFVSYGSAMGARGVQRLRETAIELQLAPVRSSVHIPVATLWAHYKGGRCRRGTGSAGGVCRALIDDLLWLLPLTRKRVNLDRRIVTVCSGPAPKSRSVALSARVRLRVCDTTRLQWSRSRRDA